jgi:hypothetical protein
MEPNQVHAITWSEVVCGQLPWSDIALTLSCKAFLPVGSQMSLILHYRNCFLGDVFTDINQLLRLLSGKLFHMHESKIYS